MPQANFELFDPQAACNAPFPLNAVKSGITLFKITTFDKAIDPSAFDDVDRPSLGKPVIRKPRVPFGLSLSHLISGADQMIVPRRVTTADGDKVMVGLDHVFLPDLANVRFAPSPVREVVVSVSDLDRLKPGQRSIRIKGRTFRIGERTLDLLNTVGEAYAEADAPKARRARGKRGQKPANNGPEKVRLRLDLETIVVGDQEALFQNRTVLYKDKLEPVEFTPVKANQFVGTGTMIARMNGTAVRLTHAAAPRYLRQGRPDGKAAAAAAAAAAAKAKAAADKAAEDKRNYRLNKPTLPTFQIGIFTTFYQDWELVGYSRGALLSSITLAPREELSIEVFTWDRYKLEEEKSHGSEYEANREINSLARASNHIAHDLSEALDTSAGVNGGLSAPVEMVNVEAGAKADVSRQVKSGIQATVDTVHESTMKSAERFRATHQVKIVQTHERGSETRTIRKIQNPNSSRTLTLNHFEILENHRVTTQVSSSKQYCLLVENPDFPRFDVDFLLAHENRLQNALLSPNYKSGFEAAKVLAGQRWFEEQSRVKVEQQEASRKTPAPTPESATGVPLRGVFVTAKNLVTILERFTTLDILEDLETITAHYNPLDDRDVGKDELSKAQDVLALYCYWTKLNLAYPGFETRARSYVGKVKGLLATAGNEDQIIAELRLLVDGMDEDWITAVKMIAASAVIGVLLTILVAGPMALLLPPLLPALLLLDNNNGLPAAMSKAKQELKSYEIQQAVQLPPPPATSAETIKQPITPPPEVYSLNELANAHADFTKLVLHLEAHRVYYQNEIWRTEDSNERFYRLELAGLTSYVENRLLGFAGKKAIYPLRIATFPKSLRNYIEKTLVAFELEDEPKKGKRPASPAIKQQQTIVTLPTAGMHLETMLGRCEALEPYLLQHRVLDEQQKVHEVAMHAEKVLQAKAETARLDARLKATPPVLDDPAHHPEPSLRINLQKDGTP